MLLEFLEIFFNEEDMAWDDVTYLYIERIEINDL
jgi:hypothetical protein